MKGIVLRMLIIMLGLYLASSLVSGVTITGGWTFIFAAILLSLVNAVIRPLAWLLTLPITIFTLGLFILVLNAGMFALVAAMLDAFTVTGFWPALFGALIVSITSTIASWYIGPEGKIEVIVVK